MEKRSLVSIIIPTYNRAHLIGETLDSILAQTYQNWECIVVDDGSIDTTTKILEEYINKDNRFKYFKRPENRSKGGNAARNYGFEMSKGDFIQWFDSDDLMSPRKIDMKVDALKMNQMDYVISKTKYFNKKIRPFPYNFTSKQMNFNNYAMGEVSWFTPDLMIKRAKLNGMVYNEELKAGQEYNFICKLLTQNLNGYKIDEFLTYRRWHNDSIGNRRKKDKAHYWETKFNSHWQTYLDIKAITSKNAFEVYSLRKCVLAYCQPSSRFKLPNYFFKSLREHFGAKAYYIYLAKILGRWFNRPYYFYNKIK